MTERSDDQLWSGIERRLSEVERFIPATPAWRPEEDSLTTPVARLLAGPTLRRADAPRRKPARRAWALLLVALALALTLLAIELFAGAGQKTPPTLLVPTASPAPAIVPIGPMTASREDHTATRLPDGRVLIAGGDHLDQSTAELFDPRTATFTQAGRMSTPTDPGSATLLAGGQVLLIGNRVSSAELYDPTNGTFRPTGSLHTQGFTHNATLLRDGRVLLAGGLGADPVGDTVTSAELYDPTTGTFRLTGSMTEPRAFATGALLEDGRVLLVGNQGPEASADLYDPAAAGFSLTGNVQAPRQRHAAVSLLDGHVLIIGGTTPGTLQALASAELYDPLTGKFQLTGSMSIARIDPRATLLPDGRVLITGGGMDPSGTVTATRSEVYDPGTGRFSFIGTSTIPFHSSSTLLSDGDVLFAGGETDIQRPPLATAFLFDYRAGP